MPAVARAGPLLAAAGALTLGALLGRRLALRTPRALHRDWRCETILAGRRSRAARATVPIPVKLAYGLYTPVVGAAYWRTYGPANFLWLSDVALASTTLAVITENRLLASMPAVGVLPLEIAWAVDFASRGKAIGFTGYMFDRDLPVWLRALSLFHLSLPPTLLWLLDRFGYDRRAFVCQTALTSLILLLSYRLTEPEDNVNWVFGPGDRPQQSLPPPLYLALEMTALPLLVFAPMHVLLNAAFERRESSFGRSWD